MKQIAFKTKVVFGEEALSYLHVFQGQRIFLVCDPFMVQSGLVDRVLDPLAGSEVAIFSEIVPDPPIDLVVRGMQQMGDFHPQVVIAFGGGSAIDGAKAMKYFGDQMGVFGEMVFVAIPTTSGTGSEVTSFAVITDPQKGLKYPLVSDLLLPDVAILAGELVKSLPKSIVADTGMDVLTHAIEAYVSTRANDFSDALAEKAVCLVFEHLLAAYQGGENNLAREKMHHASTLAGLAFNITSLGLNHAMAHVIGGKLHVPHGRTNGMLLPHIIEYNAHLQGFDQSEMTLAAKKYAHLAKLVGIGGNTPRLGVRHLIGEIVKLQKAMGMPTRLSQCQVSQEAILGAKEDIATLALADACYETNPRPASREEISRILHHIL